MPLDPTKRRAYYNRCSPVEPLAPHDQRNLDIDTECSAEVRGGSWVERLAVRIELSDTPAFVLFTGLPGSGKTTELLRLASRLEDKSKSGFLVVFADAEKMLDLTDSVDIPDLIAAILYTAERRVIEAEGGDPELTMRDGYFKRLWDWLTHTDVEFGRGEYSLPSGPKLVAEMKTRPGLRKRVRNFLASNLGQYLEEARTELRRLEARARRLGYNRLVLIFDSLEKVRGITANWEEVLQSAEKVFGGGAPHLQIPIHALYTIPVPLAVRKFTDVEFIPMLKLRTREGERFEPGYAAARQLLSFRIPREDLELILGAETDRRLDELIACSGGFPRELVRLLQKTVMSGTHPVPEPAFRRILSETQDSYERVVTEDMKPWLLRVSRMGKLSVEHGDHLEVVDRAIQNNLVYRYLNDSEWFDVAPALGRMLSEYAQSLPPVTGMETPELP